MLTWQRCNLPRHCWRDMRVAICHAVMNMRPCRCKAGRSMEHPMSERLCSTSQSSLHDDPTGTCTKRDNVVIRRPHCSFPMEGSARSAGSSTRHGYYGRSSCLVGEASTFMGRNALIGLLVKQSQHQSRSARESRLIVTCRVPQLM